MPPMQNTTVKKDTQKEKWKLEQLAIAANLMRAPDGYMPFCLKKVKNSRASEMTGFHTKSARYERKMMPDNS